MSARLVSRATIAGEVAVPWIALREIRKEVATGAGGWWWLGLRWWGGGGVRSGWWLGNDLKRVSSVIAQPSRWGSYFLFSVSVSPDAGTAHVGTRSFLAPGGGGTQRLRSNSAWAGPLSFTSCLFFPGKFQLPQNPLMQSWVEERRGLPLDSVRIYSFVITAIVFCLY